MISLISIFGQPAAKKLAVFHMLLIGCFFIALFLRKHFKMWATSRNSMISNRDKTQMKESHISLKVNDEYRHAFRTKSFADFFSEARFLVRTHPPAYLLNPDQQIVTSILESSPFLSSRLCNFKAVLIDYFEITSAASEFCSQILTSLSQVQSDYTFLHQTLINVDDYSFERLELCSGLILQDPLSNLRQQDFRKMEEKHSCMLHRLKLKKKKVARKTKMTKFLSKVSTAARGLVAAAFKALKKKFSRSCFMKYGILRKIGDQLDVAAKGTYILNRDFDTMSRLVGRLEDELEHNKAMVQFCLEKKEDRLCFQVLKELKKCELGIMNQVEELEEHVYLCLVTINRARALVIEEITSLE